MNILLKIFEGKYAKILALLVLVFTVFFSTYSIIKHNNYNSYALDLGDYDQTVWKYSELRNPENTVLGVSSLLGDHFEAILVPIGGIYKVAPSVYTLLILQAFAVAVTIVPLYFLIVKKTGEKKLGLLMCLSYLLFFGTQSAIDFDFHPIVLAVPFLISALYFFESKKYVWTSICLFIALLCKESVTFYIVFFGIYGLFTKKNTWYSLSLIGAGILSFYALTKLVMPFFLGKSYQYFQFTAFGNSLDEATVNIIKNPFKIFTTLFSNTQKILSLTVLFGSTTLLSFLGGYALFLIIPMIAERFLSDRPGGWTPYFHYSATIAPFLFYLTAIGVKRVQKFLQKRNIQLNVVLGLGILVLICTLAIGIIPYRGKRAPIFQNIFNKNFYTDSQRQSMDEAVSMVDKTSSVSAQDIFVPHLSHRDQVYEFPKYKDDAEYIVLNTERSSYPISNDELKQDIQMLKQNQNYKLIYQKEGTYLFKRT